MKEKLETINFKYKITLITFILFLLILALSPISGDDWKSYVIGKGGLSSSINNISIKDGRIISGFLINFFSYNKILFDFSFAILASYFVRMTNDFMGNVKNKYYYLYPLIGLLIVSTFTFSYNYLSVSSTIAYTFPTIIFIYYFYTLLKSDELKIGLFIKLLLFSIFICLSSIHIAIAFLIANIIYYFLRVKDNKLKFIILMLIDLIMVIISLSSIENSFFYSSLTNLHDNIPYFIGNVFSQNIILVILGAIPINLYLFQKLKNNTYVRVVITLFNVILLFSLGYNFFNYSPVNLNLILSRYNGMFAIENWYYIFYFLTYIILFVISVNHFITNKKIKDLFNIFVISSIVISLFIISSPIFDKGSIILIILPFIMMLCILAKEMNTKVFTRTIKVVITLLFIYYLGLFGLIKYIDVSRTDYIKEQIETGSNVIEVKASPTYYIWRYNPSDYFLVKDFKEFYEIGEHSEIDLKYFGLFEEIEKQIKKD